MRAVINGSNAPKPHAVAAGSRKPSAITTDPRVASVWKTTRSASMGTSRAAKERRTRMQSTYSAYFLLTFPSAEPTMREILQRINHVADLLESGRQPATGASAVAGPQPSQSPLNPFFASASSLAPPDADSSHSSPSGLSSNHVAQASAPAGISFESTLKWPIFRGLTPDCISSLVLQTNLNVDGASSRHPEDDQLGDSGRSTIGPAPGKQANPFVLSDETNIRVLCQRYLKVVHVKNPIFEISDFNMHVKRVVEHGLDWDEGSCVVVSTLHVTSSRPTMPRSQANICRCSHVLLPEP